VTDLDSADAVENFIRENGVEPLRRMLDGGQLGGKRKMYAELAVERHDALELQRQQQERDNAGLRAAIAAEAQAQEAKRAADAAVISANAAIKSAGAAESSALHAKIAWIVGLLAVVISVIGLFKR
jgi:hypothetical protein